MCWSHVSRLSPVLTDYLHKEFSLNDEELCSRHSTETLVCSDEEEGTHPVKKENRDTEGTINECSLCKCNQTDQMSPLQTQ